jgi:hypothetical protein
MTAYEAIFDPQNDDLRQKTPSLGSNLYENQ